MRDKFSSLRSDHTPSRRRRRVNRKMPPPSSPSRDAAPDHRPGHDACATPRRGGSRQRVPPPSSAPPRYAVPDHRPGYDAFAALRPLARDRVNAVNALVLLALWGAGPLLHDHPAVWLRAAARWAGVALCVHLATAAAFQALAARLGHKIQADPSAQKEYVREEIVQTVFGFAGVLGPLLAWAAANAELGRPTAFKDNVDACLPAALRRGDGGGPWQVLAYTAVTVVGAVAADAYNYWKHRLFHAELLWPWHKHHHAHRNPSALTGYAISPVYSVATFWPLALTALPEAGFWAPVYVPYICFYFGLNHYLHCGYVLPWVEAVLGPWGIMTSAYHNTHHNRGRRGFSEKDQTFGEMTTWWDIALGTHPGALEAKLAQRERRGGAGQVSGGGDGTQRSAKEEDAYHRR